MNINPSSQVWLCNVPWENDYKNVRTFENATKQLEYFMGIVTKTYPNDFTYLRKDHFIVVDDNVENIRNNNYCFYRNNGFSNKVYFAFINRMEYVSENSTRIYITTDVFQTWQFQINYNTCFIEREHVSDDTVGLHTVPENLEHGEYITYGDYSTSFNSGLLDTYICVNCLTKVFYNYQTDEYTGIDSGLMFYVNGTPFVGMLYAFNPNDSDEMQEMRDLIYGLQTLGKGDQIISIFLAPKRVITTRVTSSSDTPTPVLYYVTGTGYAINLEVEKELAYVNNSFGTNYETTYEAKNNKLLTYPYKFISVSNNAGSSNIYRYENFADKPTFKIKSIPNIGGTTKAVPQEYLGVESNEDEGINLGKLPTLPWVNDTYTNWLTQNALNIEAKEDAAKITILSGAASMVSGGLAAGLSGNPIFAIGSIYQGIEGIAKGINQIEQIEAEQYRHSVLPDSARGNINCGDLNYSSGKYGYIVKSICIKPEYAKIIDQFFEQFGYKVNELKTPNINSRPYWNYLKTINCHFEGTMPEEDLSIIRQMFNNGVTLWHTSYMYDYSRNNH